jgi:hypothetical protein
MTPILPDSDHAAAEAFAERVSGLIDAGAIAVMLSLGHRTGLFAAMAALGPATSDQIAGHTIR